MPVEIVETLIVGGGQAGIAMSHQLTLRGHSHLVVERHRIAERWRSERWDGLRFQTPNASLTLPGFPFPQNDPGGFASAGEILDFINAYAASFGAPVRTEVCVSSLHHDGTKFLAHTSAGSIQADQVVVATGPFQKPQIPALMSDKIDINQVHAGAYRNPEQLPAGAVLIVGSASSGAQIAEELMRAGRQVYLCIGRHRRFPRRYRGQDISLWQNDPDISTTLQAQRDANNIPIVFSGAYGGHTIDFRNFAAQGMILLGRAEAMNGETMHFAEGLAAQLTLGDESYFESLRTIDDFVTNTGLNLPEERDAWHAIAEPACVTHPIRSLNLKAEGITTVLWATGYSCDFGWIKLDVLDLAGLPIQHHGMTNTPGLFFLGPEWLSHFGSARLSGVGRDAMVIADKICGNLIQ